MAASKIWSWLVISLCLVGIASAGLLDLFGSITPPPDKWNVTNVSDNVGTTNTSKYLFSADPYLLQGSGWVTINYQLHDAADIGMYNFVVGHEGDLNPTILQYWNPHLEEVEYNYNCLGEYSIDKGSFTCTIIGNETVNYTHLFDRQEGSTFYWTELKNQDWSDLGFHSSIPASFDNKNEWARSHSFMIGSTNLLKLRVWIKTPQNPIYKKSERLYKYDFGLYPADYVSDLEGAIEAGDLWLIDPWTQGTNGLVYYISMDSANISGGGDYLDWYGNIRLDNINTVQSATGKINTTLYVDEANDEQLQNTSTSGFPVNNRTTCMWFLALGFDDRGATAADNVLYQEKQTFVSTYIYHDFETGVMDFKHADAENDQVTAQYTIDTVNGLNEWYFACMVLDATNDRVLLFINGTNVDNDTNAAFGAVDTPTEVYVGDNSNGGRDWDGYIDELSIFNRTLNKSEIDYLFNSGSPQPTPYQQPPFVAASAPVMQSCEIEPASPRENQDLQGYANATDFDGGNVQYYYNWTINGSEVRSGGPTGNFAEGLRVNIDNLTSGNYSVGDWVILRCMATDGTFNSSWINSSNVTILSSEFGANVTRPVLGPAVVTVWRNLTAWSVLTTNGTNAKVYFTLLVNGTNNQTIIYLNQANGTNLTPTFAYDNYDVNDVLNVSVVAEIGGVNGTTNTSTAKTVQASCVGSTKDFIAGEKITQSCILNGDIVHWTSAAFIMNTSNTHLNGGGYNLTLNDTSLSDYDAIIIEADNVNITNLTLSIENEGISIGLTNSVTNFLIQDVNINSISNSIKNGVYNLKGFNGVYNRLNISGDFGVAGVAIYEGLVTATNNIINNTVISLSDGDGIKKGGVNANLYVYDSEIVVGAGDNSIFSDDSHVYAYNVTLEINKIDVWTGGGSVRVYYYVVPFVYDSFGYGVNASNVTYLGTGASMTPVTIQTNASGYGNRLTLLMYYELAASASNWNPFNFTSAKAGYLGSTNQTNVNISKQVNILLISFFNSTIQSSPVFETTTNQFNLSVLNAYGDVNATFYYNGSAKTTSKTYSDPYYTFTANATAPLVVANNTNVSWYWNLTYVNATGNVTNATIQGNQTVLWAYWPTTFYLVKAIQYNTTETEEMPMSFTVTNYTNAAVVRNTLQRDTTNYTYSTGWVDLGSNQSRMTKTFNPGLNTNNIDNHTWAAWLQVNFGGLQFNRSYSQSYNTSSFRMYITNCSAGNDTAFNFSFVDAADNSELNVSGTGINIRVWNRTSTLFRTYIYYFANVNVTSYCMWPSWAGMNVRYDLLAKATGYDTKSVIENNLRLVNSSPIVRVIGLTNSSSTTEILINVQNENEDPYENYIVYAWLWDSIGGNYTLMGSEATDFLGQVKFYLDITDNFYKFNVTTPLGVLAYETGNFKLTQTEYTFVIPQYLLPISSCYGNIQDLNYSFYENNNTIYLNWTNLTDVATSICLDVVLINATNMWQNLASSCSVNNNGSMSYAVANNTHVMATASLVDAVCENDYPLGSVEVQRGSTIFDEMPAGFDGTFWAMIYTGTLMLIGFVVGGLIGGLLLTTIGLWFMSIVGLISLSYTAIWSLAAVVIFIIIAKGKGPE